MELSYGTTTLSFQPDPGVAWRTLPEEELGAAAAAGPEILRNAIAMLLGQMEEGGAAAGESLLLVVPDHTRRCRLDEVLGLLLPGLETRLSLRVRILVANGSHVLQPEPLVRELIGAEIYDRYPVNQHDCREGKQLAQIGTTTAGTPVIVNRTALEVDWIVTVGGILFHYFAGFGGGPKMLLPGIAGEETIRINHRRTLDPVTGQFHPDCREGNIETNPVYLDLAEIVRLFPAALSLQLVLSPQGEIAAAAAGPILPVQRELLPLVRRFYTLPIGERADVVIASAGGHPADVNLIQSHKSIHHAYQAVKSGGTVIVLAECSEGVGSAAFMDYFTGASAAEMGRELLANYLINGHTALTLKSKCEGARIILVSALPPELVRRTGMVPATSLAEAWQLARPELPAGATGLILPGAARYLPISQS
ncbi:MAG TPA: nickel-dependent lactate racemase [bacterium]|jgi:nickel-dependent lactate racemase|nr:nickel-dependent lactate racemase [bacterium]